MYCRTRNVFILIALVSLFGFGGLVSAATLEVGSGEKTSYATIQAAVDAAVDGDTIVIYPGTYSGTGNRDIDLDAKAINIQGTDPADAAVVEATVLDCEGTVDEPHRGFYATDFSGTISGLTITNALAAAGGAVYCEDSTLVLSSCHILDNGTLPGQAKVSSDGGPGGGLYGTDSTIEIIDCLISGNVTGAGLDADDDAGGAGGDGAGICVTDSALSISDTTIVNNSAGAGGSGSEGGQGGRGAGLYASEATIIRCSIEGNTAGEGGDSAATGKGTGGQGGNGGGLFCEGSVEVYDSLLAGNRCGQGGTGATAGAAGQGGGIWCGSGVIDRSTIVDNVAFGQEATDGKGETALGAGVLCSADTAVTNSILWGNTPDQIAGHDCDYVAYCNIEGDICSVGTGNLSLDPLFVESGSWVDASDAEVTVEAGDDEAVWTSGDYHLSGTSPCVNAGDPDEASDADATDLDGQPRLAGAAVDMGAYEAQELMAIYRFVSPATGKYLHTIDETEKDQLIDQSSETWTYEGVACYVYASATDAALVPAYGFWSDKLNTRFWTVSEAERDTCRFLLTNTWSYEGVAFYAYPEGSQPSGAKPVYRFWSDSLSGHFYTSDEAEMQEFVDTLSDVWAYEGIVWYAYGEEDEPDEPDDGETPDTSDATGGTYEFTGLDEPMVYVLELEAYLDGQEAQLDTSTLIFVPATSRMQMAMDFDAMTAQMNELHLGSDLLSFSATLSQIGGSIELPFDLHLYGDFDTTAVRGPYTISAKTLSFPSAADSDAAGADDVCTVVGSMAMEGEKFDVNLAVNPTDFEADGVATLASLDDSGRLELDMAETFQWTRTGQNDLLLEADIRGHVVQLYVTSIQVQTTGSWVGKLVQEDEQSEKSTK